MLKKTVKVAEGTQEIEVTFSAEELKAVLESNQDLQKVLRDTPFVDRVIKQAVDTNAKKYENYISKEDYDKAIAEKDGQLNTERMNSAIKESFSGVKHAGLLIKELDMAKLSMKDGKLEGIEGELTRLKGLYGDLFETKAPEPPKFQNPPAGGGNPPGGKLTYEQFCALSKEEKAKVPTDELNRMLAEG